MAHRRSKRQRMLEGVCRTLTETLQRRVERVARERGMQPPPEDTSAIYALAAAEAPALLDQVMLACLRAAQERGEAPAEVAEPPSYPSERKAMLSAVRELMRRGRRRG